MGMAVAATLLFVAIEAVSGWFGHSLALLSDAGHNLADAGALALSWYAVSLSTKPSHEGMTFGYHRVGVLAALVNSATLLVIGVWIAIEAVMRIRQPEPSNGVMMIVVASIAMILNLLIALRLHRDAKHDINIRSAYLHMAGDAASAFGVVIAGTVVEVTHSPLADPVVSLVIAALIVYSGFDVLKESATVLLEGTPSEIDMTRLVSAIKGVAGVLDVHDLHVWMVGPGVVACSCHIVVAEQSVREGQQVLRAVVRELEDRFHINHTTVQVEVEGCEPDDMYCKGKK
jgi:cobalt-zinc-cadmium efflux system protein